MKKSTKRGIYMSFKGFFMENKDKNPKHFIRHLFLARGFRPRSLVGQVIKGFWDENVNQRKILRIKPNIRL